MYDPAPVRPRKTDIIRTRAGCVQCRRKRRKCDEEKPRCRRCVKSMITCDYINTVEFRDSTVWAAEKVKEAKTKPVVGKVAKSFPKRTAGYASSPWTGGSADPLQSPSEFSKPYPPDIMDLIPKTTSATISQDNGHPPWRIPPAAETTEAALASLLTGGPRSWVEGAATPLIQVHSSEEWTSATDGDSPPILDWASPETASLSLYQAFEAGAHRPANVSLVQQYPVVQESYRSDCESFASNSLFFNSSQLFRSLQTSPPSPLTANNPEADIALTIREMQLEHAQGQDTDNDNQQSGISTVCQTWSQPRVSCHRQSPRIRVASSNRLAKPIRAAAIPPPLPQLLSTAREIAVGDRIYLAHSTIHMTDLLPPQLRYLQHVAANAEPMRLALMALAAANMANLYGAQERNRDGRSRWKPKDSHMRQASKLGSRTLQIISTDDLLSRPVRLGVAVLLSYYQLELGTINDLFCSMRKLEAIILEILDDSSPVEEELGILQAWSYLRTFCKRIYPVHNPYGIESRTENLLDTLEERVASPPHMIDVIRVNALHLTYRLLLYKCMRGHSSSPKEMLQNISTWWAIVKGTTDQPSAQFCEDDFDTILCEGDVYAALRVLTEKLKNCEVPKELLVNFDPSLDQNSLLASSLDTIDVSPLLSSTHERAMICIDYAFAHIVCDIGLLERTMGSRSEAWDDGGGSPPTPTTSNPWLALILRIAAGLDPAECARRNTYRTGVIGQIMRSAMLCGEPAALEFLDRFLQRMLASCACYEDILTPVHLSYLANKALLKEFALGRHVFFGGVTYHQWTSRDVVFSKGEGEYFIICGRENDGRYFNDCVPLLSKGD